MTAIVNLEGGNMGKILKGAAALAMVFGVTGPVSAATTDVFNTGPGSDNDVRYEQTTEHRHENNNDIRTVNDNPQHAVSGDTKVWRNTTGGSARSGDTVNDSLLRARVTVDNTSGGQSSPAPAMSMPTTVIERTGPESSNYVRYESRSEMDVENNNDLYIENNNEQHARSGDAVVSGNTTGGDARSGSARNVSTVDVVVDIEN